MYATAHPHATITPLDYIPMPGVRAAVDYAIDFWQRSLIFLDILRQSGNQQAEMTSRSVNAVLIYNYEIILKGDSLRRPVNYALVRVVPPEGTTIDQTRRPVVVIDPRAGQGPGIGGFKTVSEIGRAFEAGHPVYFIGFIAEPIEGQTVEDVARAHTVFLEKVVELQPEASGRPLLIGNCQAGWHAIMAACMRPDLVGPVLLAGAPLSYWAGVHGENPMRYTAGLLGGTWLARLVSDLGGGIFDGAWLISNFNSLDLANTFWTKSYNVWAQPEKEERRYLEFEKWWGAFVHLRGEELQYMVDNLFVGNKLSTARIVTRDGVRIDIRNIKSPILCFCSKADNITPPQQALDWILDNYESVEEIRHRGQTILYCLHETAGHLAIFVGAKVAAKEHSEFINYMDLIDGMPPGLYEIVISDKNESDPGAELLVGDFSVRIEERTLEDIRSLGCNSVEDEREFDAVARLSELNNAVYSMLVRPWIRAAVTPQMAAATLALQPLRVMYSLYSDRNPAMRAIAPMAEKARHQRQTIPPDNPFHRLQEQVSEAATTSLKTLTMLRDRLQETSFHAVYGSPWMQAALGVRRNERPRPKPGTSTDQQTALAATVAELRKTMGEGDRLDAVVRALVYVALGEKAIDARSFEVLRRLLKAHPEISLARYKDVLRRQWAMLTIDQEAALEALPRLLPDDAEARAKLFEQVKAIRTAAGALDGEARRRLDEMEVLFRTGSRSATK